MTRLSPACRGSRHGETARSAGAARVGDGWPPDRLSGPGSGPRRNRAWRSRHRQSRRGRRRARARPRGRTDGRTHRRRSRCARHRPGGSPCVADRRRRALIGAAGVDYAAPGAPLSAAVDAPRREIDAVDAHRNDGLGCQQLEFADDAAAAAPASGPAAVRVDGVAPQPDQIDCGRRFWYSEQVMVRAGRIERSNQNQWPCHLPSVRRWRYQLPSSSRATSALLVLETSRLGRGRCLALTP